MSNKSEDIIKGTLGGQIISTKNGDSKPLKEVMSKSEAVETLFEEHFLEQFKKNDSNKWRVEKLWTKENDEVLKENYKQIKALFENFSGKHTKPGKIKFSSMDEFINMITNTGVLMSGSIGVGDLGSIFNISMMSQVDELNFQRHIEMSLIEFIEAICRVADKLIEIPNAKAVLRKRNASIGNF